MTGSRASLPNLDQRFLPPDGWRWHSFRNPQGRILRFGTVSPRGQIPHAVVIGLPGLSEFGEKYFEVASDLLKRNLSFWVLDWQGQGLSHRHLKNRHKRHIESFEEDVADLHYFLMEYVKHSAVHPDVGRIPLVMLSHSMGAHIGLRYLHDHPDMFACAALLAPMIGIKALEALPFLFAHGLANLHCTALGQQYVYGGCNWTPDWRKDYGNGPFSGDPERDRIHNVWMEHDPELQVGSVTFRWLREAYSSCAVIRRKQYLEAIKTPCLLTLSGQEIFVENAAILAAAQRLPNATLLELSDARHEVLMERDEIRDGFFDAFDKLVREHVIEKPETLKPF